MFNLPKGVFLLKRELLQKMSEPLLFYLYEKMPIQTFQKLWQEITIFGQKSTITGEIKYEVVEACD